MRHRPRRPRTAISTLLCGLGGTPLPKYTGEPRRRREEHARGVPWLPGWHKTRDLPLSLCYPLTPGHTRVSCHGLPVGFVSPPSPPDIRQGGSTSPHRPPAPEGVVHARAFAPSVEPSPPACLRHQHPRRADRPTP